MARKFRAKIRFWKPERESGLAVVEVPTEQVAALGGLKQARVQGTINGAAYVSNVMPAGGGRLALSVTKKMMGAAQVAVGDDADFEVEQVPSASPHSDREAKL
jgi:hypothetical protein